MTGYYSTPNQFIEQSYIKDLSHHINENTIKEIENIMKVFSIHDLRNRRKILRNFIEYKIDNWETRLKSTEKIGSLNRYISLYGESAGKILFDKSNIKRKNRIKQLYFIDYNHFIKQKPFLPYKETLSEHSILQIQNIIKVFDKKCLLLLKRDMIINFLKYNVDGEWEYKIKESEKYKQASCSLEACIVRYGKIIGEKLYNEHIKLTTPKKENYTEDEWSSICKRKKSNLGLNGYIKKYGEDDGKKRWLHYIEKWKLGIDKRKKLGWKKACSLENYQRLYGKDIGYLKWKNKSIAHRKSLSLKGYISKYGEKMGRKKWKKTCQNRSITSLKAFISRYGETDGKFKYNAYTEKAKYNNSLECYIEKYGNDVGNKKYKERIIKSTSHKFNGYSKISQDLFWNIYHKLPREKTKKQCWFKELNNEFYFYINEKWAKMIYVDFKCKNCIIEFDGEYWHKLPYHTFRDHQRDNYLLNKGYNVLRIKECDYLKNKKETIKQCIKFIKENYEKT
jgi:very-short-patch-repair endonuclease